MSGAIPSLPAEALRWFGEAYAALIERLPAEERPPALPDLWSPLPPSRRRRPVARCLADGAWLCDARRPALLSLPGLLALGDGGEALHALAHALVHRANREAGRLDAPSGYHNRQFADLAERIGLRAEWHSSRLGWSRTSLGPELLEVVTGLGALPVSTAPGDSKTAPSQGGGRSRPIRLYRCCCPGAIYTRRHLQARCLRCEAPFLRDP